MIKLPSFATDYPITILLDHARELDGQSGRLLAGLLNRAGIMLAGCQIITPDEHREVLTDFNPNIIVAVGQDSINAAKHGYPKIDKWRGSLFMGEPLTLCDGFKCIASITPSATMFDYHMTYIMLNDFKRAARHSETKLFTPPQRTFDLDLSADQIIERFDDWRARPPKLLSTDLEGYWNNLTMISFSDDPATGFILPFTGGADGSYWDEYDERRLWLAMQRVLEDKRVPKVLQNGLYDAFVLAYGYGISIENIAEDTMLKHSELYCEFDKNLGFQTSLYSLEPFYKDERGSDSFTTRKLYCCKDSAVTLENCRVQETMMENACRDHYRLNMRLLSPILYMEVRGILFDLPNATRMAKATREKIYELQHLLNDFASCPLAIETEQDFVDAVRPLCFKKMAAYIHKPEQLLFNSKKAHEAEVAQAMVVYSRGLPFTSAQNGELSMLVGTGLNVDSSKQMKAFLYGTLGWPEMTKRGTKGDRVITTDALAMLRLYKGKSYKSYNHPILKRMLEQRSMLTSLSTLEIETDPDGRIRCGYNVVGTDTHRLTCYTSPTNSGFNLQTATKSQRINFRADPGRWMWQADLAGADGWTVACHCARLGDPTMLDDYNRGLKPAIIICLMYNGVQVNRLTPEELKQQHDALKSFYKTNKKEAWLYDAAKAVQHGSNYDMKPPTMSDNILKRSYKETGEPVLVPVPVCDRLQKLYMDRYRGVPLWKRWVANELQTKRTLTAASGSIRRVHGRVHDETTIRSLLAHEPQHNTTFACNRTLVALWEDQSNRFSSYVGLEADRYCNELEDIAGLPAVDFVLSRCRSLTDQHGAKALAHMLNEPLHQVHDASMGQFYQELTDWAKVKIPQYFQQPITIAGITITIPFEGAYGTSWGELDNTL